MAGGIVNATTLSGNTVTITTKDSSNVTIDGPTASAAFQLIKVSAAMLGNNAVNSSKIADGTVGTADLADGAVTSTKMSPGAVGSSQLSTGSVWGTHILDGTVGPADLSFDPATQAELDTHKGSADHDTRYFTEAELSTPGTINTTSNPVDWTKLKNVPSGFADGTDDVGGSASGWTDDGTVVRLTTNTDNVGIGTSIPSEKLEIGGGGNLFFKPLVKIQEILFFRTLLGLKKVECGQISHLALDSFSVAEIIPLIYL